MTTDTEVRAKVLSNPNLREIHVVEVFGLEIMISGACSAEVLATFLVLWLARLSRAQWCFEDFDPGMAEKSRSVERPVVSMHRKMSRGELPCTGRQVGLDASFVLPRSSGNRVRVFDAGTLFCCRSKEDSSSTNRRWVRGTTLIREVGYSALS